jgi:D-alanyl-D-alanine carboxypeptidase (penicillin-binding protein 5/6)
MYNLFHFNRLCKKFLCFIIVLSIVCFGTIIPVNSENNMNLKCKSAILLDFSTGKVLYEQNPHEKLEPASVTKVMTMLLIMEALDSKKINLEDKVTISSNADSSATEGTKLLLETGEVRTVKDLLYGIAVESANDACIAIAEFISGSHEEFVKLMNKRAKELGCNDTNFVNANGLPAEGHVTSAYDLAIMSRELLKHNEIFEYISTYMIKVTVGKKNNVVRELANKNKMLVYYKDIDGIKTGWTQKAGYCISVTAKKNNMRLISVVMGSTSTAIRNSEARKLLDYGFANYSSYIAAKKGDKIGEVRVSKGSSDMVNAVAETDITALIQKGEEKSISKVVNIPSSVNAPIKKGEKIGELVLYKNDAELGKYNLVSESDIYKSSFINNIKRSFQYWIGNSR